MSEPYLRDPDVTLYCGDVLAILRELEDESVDCIVTSPPYWGLRDYGTESTVWGGDLDCEHAWGEMERGKRKDIAPADETTLQARVGTDERQEGAATNGGRFCELCDAWLGSFGLEPTPDLYVEHAVAIFAEIRRVLAQHGTLWLNLGDSYASKSRGSDAGWSSSRLTNPARVQKAQAAALRNGGERHRGKSAGLKEKDLVGIPWRVAFALQADGWWLRSDIVWAKPNPMPSSVTDRPTNAHEYVFMLAKSTRYFFDQDAVRETFTSPRANGPGSGAIWAPPPTVPQVETLDGSEGEAPRGPDGRRKTSILSGNGSHLNQERDGERWPAAGRNVRSVWTIATQPYPDAHFAVFPQELPRRCIASRCPEDGIVLDPFAGAGTTLLVARKFGRRAIGIELNPDYCALASERLSQQSLFAEASA